MWKYIHGMKVNTDNAALLKIEAAVGLKKIKRERNGKK